MQDMPLAQTFQDQIKLLGLKGRLTGNETLIDIVVVRKQPSVITQESRYHLIFIGGIVLQTVEVVPAHGEHHPGLIILFLRIFNIAGTVQDLQSRIHLNGEVVIGMTELVDIKLESMVIS